MLPRPRPLLIGVAASLLSFGAVNAGADGAVSAADFLVFESVADGRCQILSDGGKLRVMRNQHDARPIKYRLTRVFVGKPQGLSVGVAEPGNALVKLGCTRVDGRVQDWVVERAHFVTDQS